MPDASPPSSGRVLEMAVPSDGMNASDIPRAATSDAGSTSTQKFPPARIRDSPAMPTASTARPVTVIALGLNRAIARGASTIMPIMMRTVMGSSAAPLGKAV